MDANPAAAPDVDVFAISTPAECAALAGVLADVWGFADRTAVASPDTLRAMAYSGCYVAGVCVDGRLVGGGFGWPMRDRDEWRLHSHVIGFLDGHRALGLGARIKHHQRDFARDAGMAAVEWTFDPLHAANARFNLAKLGARVVAFHDDFYGELADTFSAGLGSDRFVVRWGIDDAPASLADQDRQPILAIDGDGRPVVLQSDHRRVTARLPGDIVALRRGDRSSAIAWRDAFAATVGAEVARGATVVGITPGLEYLIDRP